MWRSTSRFLLSASSRQRPSIVRSRISRPQTLVSTTPPTEFRSLLARSLSANPDIGPSIPEDTTSHFGKHGVIDEATGDNSSIFEDASLHLEKREVFAEGDDGGCLFPDDGSQDLGDLVLDGGEEEAAKFDVEKFEEVLSVLQGVEPELVESSLGELDLVPSEELAMRVLGSSEVPVVNLIVFFAWAFKRPDFVRTSPIVDLFVEKVVGSPEITVGEALSLWGVIREIGKATKGLLSAKMLNLLITTFAKLGRGNIVLEVYGMFDEMGCAPDADTYYLTIHALGKPYWAATVWGVCEKMVSSKKFPDSDKLGKVIKFFCKGGRAKDAYMVYLAAKESEKMLPSLYMDILIDYLSRKDDTLNLAMDLLDEYQGQLKKASIKPFACVISGLCRIKDAKRAKELLNRMLISGPPPVNVVFNNVITVLSKAGEVEDAVSLLKTIMGRGLKPDIRAYNVLMSAYSKAGMMNEASDIFSKAKKVHGKLGRVSYHILSRGYCRIEDFENAIKCMYAMKEEGLLPNVDDYKKMIQSLCLKALDWRTAEQLLEDMKSNGLYLDGQTRGLIASVKELEEEEKQSLGEVAEA